MDIREVFHLIPKRYQCLYCGEWHEFDKKICLRSCDWDNKILLMCPNVPSSMHTAFFRFYFDDDGKMYYKIFPICDVMSGETVVQWSYMNERKEYVINHDPYKIKKWDSIDLSWSAIDSEKPIAWISPLKIHYWYEKGELCYRCDFWSKCDLRKKFQEGLWKDPDGTKSFLSTNFGDRFCCETSAKVAFEFDESEFKRAIRSYSLD